MLAFCGHAGQRARALYLYDVFRRHYRCYLSKYSALLDTTRALAAPEGELNNKIIWEQKIPNKPELQPVMNCCFKVSHI